MFPANSRRKSPRVVVSVSKSSPKTSKAPKPNFRPSTFAKTNRIGAFSPNLATLLRKFAQWNLWVGAAKSKPVIIEVPVHPHAGMSTRTGWLPLPVGVDHGIVADRSVRRWNCPHVAWINAFPCCPNVVRLSCTENSAQISVSWDSIIILFNMISVTVSKLKN